MTFPIATPVLFNRQREPSPAAATGPLTTAHCRAAVDKARSAGRGVQRV